MHILLKYITVIIDRIIKKDLYLRDGRTGGQEGGTCVLPLILESQLTLYEPEGGRLSPSPHTLQLAPQDFQTFRHPCILLKAF